MQRIASLVLVWLAPFCCAAGDDALARLGAANQLFAAERYEEAAQEYEAALRADAGLDEARQQLAICLFETHAYDRAVPLFSEMAARPKTARMAQYYLGRVDLSTGKPDAALQHLRAVLGPQPFRDEHYFLGSACYKLERFDEAAVFLRKAITLNRHDSRAHQLLARVYRKTGHAADADREFAETRELSQYYLEGSVALKRCKLALSSGGPEFRDACLPLTESDDVDKLSAVGVILGESQRHPEAKAVLEKAVALDPDSPEIRYDLALSCFYLKELKEACEQAAAAIAISPNFPEAFVVYGTALYLSGAHEEALPVLRRAHSLRPDDASVERLLGAELLRAADQAAASADWKQAEDLLNEASKLMPNSTDLADRLTKIRSHSAQ